MLLDSQIYKDILNTPIELDRNMVNKDGADYRINEMQEIVIGIVIIIKDSAVVESNSNVPLSEFSWSKHQYNLVFVNVLNILLPTYSKIENALFADYQKQVTKNSSVLIISLVMLIMMLLAILSAFVFLKKSFSLRRSLLSPFIHIPDSKLKAYHSQTEYYSILFTGMQDRHVDDLKNEMTNFHKMVENTQANEAKNSVYGRKRKLFKIEPVVRQILKVVILSFVIFVMAY